MHRYQLSLWFALTSVVLIGAAAIVVNMVIGNMAERNLVRIAEENTEREAQHIQSMMRRTSPSSAQGILTLEFLQDPSGLQAMFPSLIEGFNVVKLNLIDLNGQIVWSSDSKTKGLSIRENPFYEIARGGGSSSELVTKEDPEHLDGVGQATDIVETYVPLRESAEGDQIGVLEIYRDVSTDMSIQVRDTKSAVLWTTALVDRHL